MIKKNHFFIFINFCSIQDYFYSAFYDTITGNSVSNIDLYIVET